MQDIIDHSDKPWNWGAISRNPKLTPQIIRDHPDKPWNWKTIEQNLHMTREDIVDPYGVLSGLSKDNLSVKEYLALMHDR